MLAGFAGAINWYVPVPHSGAPVPSHTTLRKTSRCSCSRIYSATGLADRPMVSEIDIWRAANLLIQRHGTDAEIEAAKRADQMLERGDLDGNTVWKWIRRAIIALQAPASGRLH
jgi:hypothetical protein